MEKLGNAIGEAIGYAMLVLFFQLGAFGFFQSELSNATYQSGSKVSYSGWFNSATVVKVEYMTDDFALVRGVKMLFGPKEEAKAKAYLIQSDFDGETKWVSEQQLYRVR